MDITFRNKQRKKDRANAERMAKKAMDKLITRKEAASILGISVKTLDAARTDGLISYVQYVENGCAPCKTDGTCCDISQTSKLSAVKIDIVEYGR